MPLAICVDLKSQIALTIYVILRLKADGHVIHSLHAFLAFEFPCVNRESEIACVERELVACLFLSFKGVHDCIDCRFHNLIFGFKFGYF